MENKRKDKKTNIGKGRTEQGKEVRGEEKPGRKEENEVRVK